MNKKQLLPLIMGLSLSGCSIFGSPIKYPDTQSFLLDFSKITNYDLDVMQPKLDATLLVTDAIFPSNMFSSLFLSFSDNKLSPINASWAIPLTSQVTAYLISDLNKNYVFKNIVHNNLNIRQDYTLYSSSILGPVLNESQNTFSFEMDFSLYSEKTHKTYSKRIRINHKYELKVEKNHQTAADLVTLVSNAVTEIGQQLDIWIFETVKKDQNFKVKKSN